MLQVFCFQVHCLTNSLRAFLTLINGRSDCRALIHVDAKTDITPFLPLASEKVELLSERVQVTWGGVSQAVVMFKFVKETRKRFKSPFYFHHLSGEDIVLTDLSTITEFLSRKYPAEFIGFDGGVRPSAQAVLRVRYKYPDFFRTKNQSFYIAVIRAITRAMFSVGFFRSRLEAQYNQWYKGSNWFSITDQAIKVIAEDPRVEFALENARRSLCFDEVLFHTVLANSERRRLIFQTYCGLENDNIASLRYVNWVDGPAYPKVLDLSDIPDSFSSPVFFARKISTEVTSNEILEFVASRSPLASSSR